MAVKKAKTKKRTAAKTAVRTGSPKVGVKRAAGGKFCVTVGGQAVSRPMTKALAEARVKQIEANRSGSNAPRKSPATNPVAVPASRLHVISITPGNYGVFLGKLLLKSRFKTAAGAEAYKRSILARRKNPSPTKVAEHVGRQFLKTFDVDRDGDLDRADLRILDHFNDPAVVIDESTGKAGNVIGRTGGDDPVVEWADGTVTTEAKDQVVKANGLRSWYIRRKASHHYRRELKHGERAAKARGKRRSLESALRNPSSGDQKTLAEFRLAVKRLANKSAKVIDLQHAMDAGKRAGFTQAEVWRLVRKTWNASAGKSPKRNPGVISTLAEIAMGVSAALDVKKQLASTPATRAKARAKKRTEGNKPVRPGSQKANPGHSARRFNALKAGGYWLEHIGTTKWRLWNRGRNVGTITAASRTLAETEAIRRMRAAKKNPSSRMFSAFQGRPSTKATTVSVPKEAPDTGLWILGRLHELRIRGYGRLLCDPNKFYLVANRTGTKMYIGGPPITKPVPSLADGEKFPLGLLTHVVYETEKHHLGDAPGDPTPYIHEMGEEGGEKPLIMVDKTGRGYFEGGDWEITPEGIRN